MNIEQVEQLQMRIDELEMRQAFQEDMLTELNAIMSRQDGEIMRLIAQVKSLSDKHQDLRFRVDQSDEPGNDRPPHY